MGCCCCWASSCCWLLLGVKCSDSPSPPVLLHACKYQHCNSSCKPCWHWLCVGTGNDPRDRQFKTVTQGLRYDPEAVLIRAWVPQLAALQPAERSPQDPQRRGDPPLCGRCAPGAASMAAECAPGGSRAGHRLEDWLHWSHARKRLSVPATCSLPTAASLLLQFQRQNASPLPFFAPHAKPSLIPPMPPALTPACSAHTRAARAPAGWLTRQPTA